MHLSTVFSATAALLAASALAAPVSPDERAERGDLGPEWQRRVQQAKQRYSAAPAALPQLTASGGLWGVPYITSLIQSLPRAGTDWTTQWTRRHSSPAGRVNVPSFEPDRDAVKVCAMVVKLKRAEDEKKTLFHSLSHFLSLSFVSPSFSWHLRGVSFFGHFFLR